MKAVFMSLFYLLSFCFLDYAFPQTPPQLNINDFSHPKVVRPSASITLECPVRNIRDLIVEWYKDREALVTFGKNRLRILSNGSLRIKEARFDDTGIYKCRAVNGFGSVEYNITLLVIGTEEDYEQYEEILNPDEMDMDEDKIGLSSKPHILHVSETNSTIYKALGSSFLLQCVATGHPRPEMRWLKDGHPMSNQLQVGRWAFKFSKFEESGNYSCVAQNQLGLDSHSFVILVDESGQKYRGKPLISGSNVTVEEGQRATMECGVESVSVPHIEWLKQVTLASEKSNPDNRAIEMEGEYFHVLTKPSSVDYRLQQDVYLHQFVIDHARLDDAGKYVCLGANKFGYEYQFTYLDVIPRINAIQSSLPFPIVVTAIVVTLAIVGCIMAVLFYCRPKRTRVNSPEVSMVTKHDFIPLHPGSARSITYSIQPHKSRQAQHGNDLLGI